MRSARWLGISLAVASAFLAGCGHHGPSSFRYTTSVAVYTKGAAAAANSPAGSGGTAAAYSVSPSLPAGLLLNAGTGVITGTPTVVAAQARYTVIATGANGSATALLTITVNDQPPSALSYAANAPVYLTGMPITADEPTSSGGAVISYSVNPALPKGLRLSTTTGIIGGRPWAASAAASYTVTAVNSGGSTTATLTITVNAAGPGVQFIPNMNQWITPQLPTGSLFASLDTGLTVDGHDWLAGQAVTTVVSPDGKTLLVLTSGFNRVTYPEGVQNPDGTITNWEDSLEYVFIYDISAGAPALTQVVTIPNSYSGIAFDPIRRLVSGQMRYNAFYVSSGMGDYPFTGSPYTNAQYSPSKPGLDNVHTFALNSAGTAWEEQPELALGHASLGGVGFGVQPCAAGVAVSDDGQTLVVANYYNDSISVFTGGLGNWTPLSSLASEKPGELDLRPGKAASSPSSGTPGGEYPYWVAIATTTSTSTSATARWAYVSSIRDREIDVVNLDGTPEVAARIKVKGQPNKMTLNKAESRLYVAEDQSDTVDVIDINPNDGLKQNTVIESIAITRSAVPSPLVSYTGANTNSVALSPDEKLLYVTNGNLNSVAVVALTGTDTYDGLVGLIPTGWYPNSASASPDGKWLYVVNGKSPTGPNPNFCYGVNGPKNYPSCLPTNEYNPQLIKAGLQSIPTATLAAQLPALTAQVVTNNRLSSQESAAEAGVMQSVREGVKHVIFVIKENRTYDQILGDLESGNGDPSLVEFGEPVTPNLHHLARTFVTLDHILATSEVSYDGWSWTTGARATDVVEHQYTVNYANRGLSLDFNGFDRNVNVAIPTLAGRLVANPYSPNDPDALAGQTDVAAPDGPDDEVNTGHLWDAALRAGLTVRNYGFFVDPACYNFAPCAIPLLHDPFATGTVVAYPANVALTPLTDLYYRGFDPNFPDYYRFTEWAREFDANYAAGGLPSLSLVEMGHDHTGSFATAIDGVNTPELQEADNDYAVGLLIQKVAGSIYANNTLIFIIEDDAQDGGDHVDSHRTTAYVAGAYVKQGAVVSAHYNTLDFVRTIEEVLGIPPMNLNDALAHPMAGIFNTTPSSWSFTAAPSAYLYNTQLPLPQQTAGLIVPKPTHSARYWAHVTRGMDFTDADKVDAQSFNRILWRGMMGSRPYPSRSSGKDLSQNREQLLARYRRSLVSKAARTARPASD